MPTTVQFRRGTTAQNNAFTGAAGEISIDTEKKTLRIHDASTAGGSTLLSSGGATQSIESSTTATPDFTFKNTTDDATGPVLRLESDRATPADSDVAGTIEFKASDDAGAQVLTANIVSKITDVSNGSEDGNLEFTVHAAGSSTKIATIDASGITVNSGSLIATTGDFQTVKTNVIESDDSTKVNIQDALEVDGALDVGAGFTISNTTSVTSILDEDAMGSDSDTALATQQSIKAYVDAQDANIASDTLTFTNKTFDANGTGNSITNIDSGNFLSGFFKDEDNMASNSATSVASQQSIKAYVDSEIGALSSVAITEGNTNVTVADSGTGTVTVTVDGATHSVFAAAGITLSQGNFVGTSTSAQYADLAEMYSADAEYEPGTVMSFGGNAEITQSVQSHDARVAGVVSTAPAYLMNADLESGTALALQGRTPCKVIGRIHKGDMLVASDTPGVATAMQTESYMPGCVIGKAIADYDSQTVGIIEVVIGRV